MVTYITTAVIVFSIAVVVSVLGQNYFRLKHRELDVREKFIHAIAEKEIPTEFKVKHDYPATRDKGPSTSPTTDRIKELLEKELKYEAGIVNKYTKLDDRRKKEAELMTEEYSDLQSIAMEVVDEFLEGGSPDE